MEQSFPHSFSSIHDKKLSDSQRIFQKILNMPETVNVERALFFTRSMQNSQHLSIFRRWSKALANVMDNISIHILPEDVFVGRGGEGRYCFFYPELQGDVAFFQEYASSSYFTEQDITLLKTEILPFWTARNFQQDLLAKLPEECLRIFKKFSDNQTESSIASLTTAIRHSQHWTPDFSLILTKGFYGIEEDARSRLSCTRVMTEEQKDFYFGVIEICQAIKRLSERYADYAEYLISCSEKAEYSRTILADISQRCRRVPYYPAKNFSEALQSVWFTLFILRLEQKFSGRGASLGRMDQYLFPFYSRDIADGVLTRKKAGELLDALWTNMAQVLQIRINRNGKIETQSRTYYETVTIGGQTTKGEDAVNELTYLILESSQNFPLTLPYVCIRIHDRTPKRFLRLAINYVKKQNKSVRSAQPGILFPEKELGFINDEAVVSFWQERGASLEEAFNYCCGAHCNTRIPGRSHYLSTSTGLNLVAVLEVTLRDGFLCRTSPVRQGLATGKASDFKTFDEFVQAFLGQLSYFTELILQQIYIADSLRASHFASPVTSALHSLCMQEGQDINHTPLPNAPEDYGPLIGVNSLGSVIDSLAAIREIVFCRHEASLQDLISAVDNNFNGFEPLRRQCLNAPKYGNNIPEVDKLGKIIIQTMKKLCDTGKSREGKPVVIYERDTPFMLMDTFNCALPNGKFAGENFSQGVSADTGNCENGPTDILKSVASLYSHDMQFLTLRIPPQSIAGEEGSKGLLELLRMWHEKKLWYIQFSLFNREDFLQACNSPENFKTIIIRSPGFFSKNLFLTTAKIEKLLGQ